MSDDIRYKYSREEVICKIQEEFKLAENNYKSTVSICRPGKQGKMDLYFAGKKAAYNVVMELLAEILDFDDDPAGDNTDSIDHPPLQPCSPAYTPMNELGAQEVI